MTAPAPPEDLLHEVRSRLARTGGDLTAHAVSDALREAGRPVGHATVLAVHAQLAAEITGAGPLTALLQDDDVTDVLVNGAEGVWVDRGLGLERAALRLGSEEEVRRLAQRLAATGGRRLDDATPYVDVRLGDGTRCHAVLAPVARPGTLISLRVPPRSGFSLDGLAERGMLTADGLALVRRVVRSRLAFLVSGGTGAGKTTLLAAMLAEVDPAHRVLVVEEASELRPAHPHVVALEAHPGNVEGTGAIAVRTLVRQAMRMRPDRLVVGEVRGPEVVELLAALNTGHEGGCGTLHANSAADVPARVEALAAPAGLAREATHSQLASAVGVVLHLARRNGGRRILVEVGVPERDEHGWVRMASAVRFVDGATVPGPGLDRLAERLP